MSRILAWGRRAVIQQHYSLGLWKVVLFLVIKIILLAIKSLIYYTAFFDSEDSNLYRSVINILYRGITAEAQPVTLVFATLILPMTTLAFLFLPSIIYVLITHIKKSKKDLRVIEHAMLIVYPIFTNLLYIKIHKTQAII